MWGIFWPPLVHVAVGRPNNGVLHYGKGDGADCDSCSYLGHWWGKTVRAWCDNAAVVSTINHRSSQNQDTMNLTRCLAFISAKLDIHIVASHIRAINNTLANALSRNNLSLFRSLYPQASPEPTAIPLDLLVVTKPDWTSRSWTELWSAIF